MKILKLINGLLGVLVGFFAGIYIGVPGVISSFNFIVDRALDIAVVSIVTLILLSITIMLLWVFRRQLWHRLIGASHVTLVGVTDEVGSLTRAILDKRKTEAVTHVENVLKGAVAWYSSSLILRFAFIISFGIFTAFVGMVGTILLFRQTQYLGQQNEVLKQQTLLLDAQTRDVYITEFGSVIEQIRKIVGDRNKSELDVGIIPSSLMNQIVFVNRSFKPYYLADVSTDGGTELGLKSLKSPERGYVLRTLTGIFSNLNNITNITNAATFAYADVKGDTLQSVGISHIDLRHADLTSAKIWYADLDQAKLQGADLRNATIFNSNLSGADLRSSNLTGACFSWTLLEGAKLGSADIKNTNFNGAIAGVLDHSLLFTEGKQRERDIKEKEGEVMEWLQSSLPNFHWALHQITALKKADTLPTMSAPFFERNDIIWVIVRRSPTGAVSSMPPRPRFDNLNDYIENCGPAAR